MPKCFASLGNKIVNSCGYKGILDIILSQIPQLSFWQGGHLPYPRHLDTITCLLWCLIISPSRNAFTCLRSSFFSPEFWWERKSALRLKLHSKAWDSFFHLECGSYVFWSFLECPEPSHSFAIGVLMAGGGVQFLHTPICKLSAYQPVVSDLKRHLFLILYTKEEPHKGMIFP